MNSVLVLLSTYNGQEFLREQLESIYRQQGVEYHILVRDDGSEDATVSILKEYQSRYGKMTICFGDNLGVVKSFYMLMEIAEKEFSKYDYYAFCDQDDIWLPSKLYNALIQLHKFPKSEPSLYFCHRQLVDQTLRKLPTPLTKVKTTLAESIISNPSAGCTQVFNRNLLSMVLSYSPSFISMHDSWVYRICLSVNGNVYYDKHAYILYRQHSDNVVGGSSNVLKKIKRYYNSYLLNENIRYTTAKILLEGYRQYIPEHNKMVLEAITIYRDSLKNKIKLIINTEMRTSKFGANVMFVISVLLGRF